MLAVAGLVFGMTAALATGCETESKLTVVVEEGATAPHVNLPSVPTLMAFLFSMGLIPVVGGVVSGIVMGTIAYVHTGFAGVAVFFVSTFLLHKIESYYLSPRLTDRKSVV